MSSESWAGKFGDDYTARNVVDWRTRAASWRTMLGAIWDRGGQLATVLEVGANRGHNLEAISFLTRKRVEVRGIDINATAAAESGGLVTVGVSPDLPTDGADLVFTAGLLIHLPDPDFVMLDIVRASRRWVLAIEYTAPERTEVTYRGKKGMLWKEDFGRRYERLGLVVRQEGDWTKADGWDDCHWWLLEKV